MIQKLHVSKNLFDKDNATVYDCYVTTNGQWAAGTGNKTVRISCSSNTQYTLSTASTYAAFRIMETGSDNIPSDGSPVSGTLIYYGSGNSYAFTTSNTAKYIIFQANATSLNQWLSELMLNTGQTALPYEPYGDTWNTKSYAKIVDTTQQVTSFPVVVRPMENTIPNWTIKGNMVQDGTPSPSNIIYPSECGERTKNLCEKVEAPLSQYRIYIEDFKSIIDDYSTFTLSFNTQLSYSGNTLYLYADSNVTLGYITGTGTIIKTFNLNTENKELIRNATNPYIFVYVNNVDQSSNTNAMLVSGSTAPSSYIPYGYVLPFKTGSTTTPVYLGQVESTRRIKKLALTGQENFDHYGAGVFWVKVEDNNAMINGYGVSNSYVFNPIILDVPTTIANNEFCLTSANGRLWIRNTNYSNAGDFKAYLAQRYAAGTPVAVWYVLATETTGVVNEPLRKIGTYSDSVSGTNLSVTAQSPTTIDVDTSLKPSEMDLTYTGLKMCKRKKRVNGAWV